MKWLETQREYQYGPESYNMFGRRPLGNILEGMKKTPYVKLFINNPLVVVPIIIAVGIYIKQKKVSEILGVTGWKIALLIPVLWATFKFGKPSISRILPEKTFFFPSLETVNRPFWIAA